MTRARAALARAWLGPLSQSLPPSHITGAVALRAHQRVAVMRLRAALDEFGGALLADETGLGKTYVAIAMLAEAERPLVVVPAALAPMWTRSLEVAGVRAPVHTIEALSHGRLPSVAAPDLVVVDEAHHVRNPGTRRYVALTRITAGARVLLVSATPVHNRRDDLTAILALFLGHHAHALDDAALGRIVVRRLHDADAATRPRIEPPRWLVIPDDDATLHDIMTLPAPVPPSDGAGCAALVAHGLVRQWASSGGALRAALRRRLERAAALEAALTAGRHPTYRELRGWSQGEGAVQLAFPELLVPDTCPHAGALLAAVREHARAVRVLLDRARARVDPDIARADRVREILRRHTGAKVVAFSAYEDTVRALGRHLARDARIGVLGAHGAAVAGGRLSRRAALARFAPLASGEPPPRGALAIDVLLTTDLLSEGVNLQDASVVVHLDLPWTPARMEQRVGRAARLGSPHERVFVYAMAPPATSETVLGVEQILREKLRRAAATVGISGSILPPMLGAPPASDMRAVLEHWLSAATPDAPFGEGCPSGTEPVGDGYPCGAVRAPRSGYLAAVRIADDRLLVADLGGGPMTDARSIERAVALGDGAPVASTDDAGARAETAVRAWAARRQAATDAGANDVVVLRAAHKIAQVVRRAAAHRRPAVAALAARARRAAVTPLGAGAERVLAELVDAELPDEAWLRALAAFADAHGRPVHRPPAAADGGHGDTPCDIIALLLFQSEPPG